MSQFHPVRQQGIKNGLIGGVVAVLLALVGMVQSFAPRDIVSNVVHMGHTLLLLVAVFTAYTAAKKTDPASRLQSLLNSVLSGAVVGLCVILFVAVGRSVNLRMVLVNASPILYDTITLGRETGVGAILVITGGAACGLFAGLLFLSPESVRRVLIAPLSSVILAGVLQDLIRPTLAAWGRLSFLADWLFTSNGLTKHGAFALWLFIAVGLTLWAVEGEALRQGYKRLPDGGRRSLRVAGYLGLVAFLLILPHVLGLFLSEVLTIVGLYVLLGLGLNIVIGYAGLLDLGYVAFFAIGSYTTAILTSSELGFFSFSFWGALPFAVFMGIFSGVILGTPVLKMRGDYLAIATLGFGEIIRILVLSDWLRPWLGGAQGIGRIPKASIGGYEFGGPQEIYYLILVGCLLVIFISTRLRDSRIGRAWMAVREDEDVAQAMGINLVGAKLLAFATGAGFSALSGAIFASKLSSVYPHSFNVMISINIVCLIIVGGMGSIPGVIVGAAALVGLPELLREFAEYRLLVYGAALVVVMLVRPEGLWPEAVHRRELHEEEFENGEAAQTAPSQSG
ncbi:MAG: branched-chain amino acid ABC transporter permease [Deltaproteobacteria bacterium]|nr:branched-chain amino acid ABC transporter permease [Deltaproteobacteria bacterium]